jgi:hypothetical protein
MLISIDVSVAIVPDASAATLPRSVSGRSRSRLTPGLLFNKAAISPLSVYG